MVVLRFQLCFLACVLKSVQSAVNVDQVFFVDLMFDRAAWFLRIDSNNV